MSSLNGCPSIDVGLSSLLECSELFSLIPMDWCDDGRFIPILSLGCCELSSAFNSSLAASSSAF